MTNHSVKKAMKDGIIRLLKKQNFLKITVTDLIKESGVSRASFYRMYHTVDEVVDEVMLDVKKSFQTRVIPIIYSNNESAIKEIMKEFFTKVQNNAIPIIDFLPENIPFLAGKLEHNALISRSQKFQNIDDKFSLSLYIVTVVTIARVWGYYGFQESVDDIVNYTYHKIYNK